jgi:DNA-binding beta-propeller fold protein YncE
VAVSQSRGEVYVSHLQLADNPVGSGQQATAYFIRNPVDALSVPDESFFPLGAAGVHAIVVGSRYAFLTGRLVSPAGPTLRAVDLNEPTRWLAPALEDDFRVLEARGLALNADETRLYVVGRSPDTLLVVDMEGAATSDLKMRVGRAISLPAGANQVRLIPRVGQGPLVAVTCSTAGVVVLYDEESGDLIAQVPAVGEQPFGLTVDQQGNGARLYVSNFEDGRIAVIDIPDLTRPAPKLVAHLGERQTCIVKPKDALCVGSSL